MITGSAVGLDPTITPYHSRGDRHDLQPDHVIPAADLFGARHHQPRPVILATIADRPDQVFDPSDASTRATLGVVAGPAGTDKAEAEQALLDRALIEYAFIFTRDRCWVMDRNFPGVTRIKRILATGTHVLIRIKSDITLTRISDFFPDGSYLAIVSGGGEQITMRVIEYLVQVGRMDLV